MIPNSRTLGPLEPTLPSLAPNCIPRFYNRTTRSNHMWSQHPQFQVVPDLQQQANAPATRTSSNSIPSSKMSSPPTHNMPLDSRSQSKESEDHTDPHNLNHNDYNDHNNADELPVDDLNPYIPFDGEEYQHSNGGNRSESPGL